MDGYRAESYGEGMADVYDEWYAHTLDTTGLVELVRAWAAPGAVLELGVGTGRLAAPLCAAGLDVVGIDASPAMLARASAPGPGRLTTVLGDMGSELPEGPFGLVLCGFNTLFNLTEPDAQRRCLTMARQRIVPGGALVVEAAIPEAVTASAVEVKALSADSVTLSVSRADAAAQRIEGQFVTIRAEGITLRPWALRWLTPAQLDDLAHQAGWSLAARYADYAGTPFENDADADRHVSIYR